MRRLLAFVGLLVVAATWFTWLRPTALGGDVSYVVVDGSSMEPTFEDGDLVLVRDEESYAHGDVIAYRAGGHFRDPTRIIHRIVGDRTGGGYVTQGDNRDRTDPWFPTDDDIIGRSWMHVPLAGQGAVLVSQPQAIAVLGGAAAVVGRSRRRRPRRSRQPTTGSGSGIVSRTQPVVRRDEPARRLVTRGNRMTQPTWAFVGLVVSLVLAAPVLALGWSALRAPDTVDVVETTGALDLAIDVDYRFRGDPSPVYPSGAVEASPNAAGAVVPDGPLYSRLLDRLDVTVSFRADRTGPGTVSSTFSVDADVSTPGGWTTTLESVVEERFEGTTSQDVSIDLRDVAAQVASVATLTGVGGDAYTITLAPRLDVAADTGSSRIEEQLAAPVAFAVEGNLVQADVLAEAESVPLTVRTTEDARYTIGPLQLPTQPARAILGGLALVLVAGVVWFASVLFGGVGLGEPDRIAARYRAQMVDVAVATAPPGPVVMVGGIDELSRIAKVEQSVILHEDLGEGAHRYRVFLGSVTYEYDTAPEHGGAAAEDSTAGTPEPSG